MPDTHGEWAHRKIQRKTNHQAREDVRTHQKLAENHPQPTQSTFLGVQEAAVSHLFKDLHHIILERHKFLWEFSGGRGLQALQTQARRSLTSQNQGQAQSDRGDTGWRIPSPKALTPHLSSRVCCNNCPDLADSASAHLLNTGVPFLQKLASAFRRAISRSGCRRGCCHPGRGQYMYFFIHVIKYLPFCTYRHTKMCTENPQRGRQRKRACVCVRACMNRRKRATTIVADTDSFNAWRELQVPAVS